MARHNKIRDIDVSVEKLKEITSKAEAGHIEYVLDLTGRNLCQSCRLLGIARNTLKSKMKEYGL